MPDLSQLSIRAALDGVRSGEWSTRDVAEACLRRIEELDEVLRAFVHLDPAGVLERADAADARLPLGGIPLAIKDLVDVAAMPTTASSRVLAGNLATQSAPVVRRLEEAGGIVAGKTNTQEFAYGVVTAPTRNPWDPARIPGGSSGGSAVAVASGMALGALGTDTAGSIRIPAALCGVTGLKPRRDALPMDGIVPLAPSLDSCGPIAADADGCRILWEALTTTGVDPPPLRGLTLGLPADLQPLTGADDEVCAAVEDAARALAGAAGTELRPVDVPPFEEWAKVRGIPLMAEALAVHRRARWYPDRAEDYREETRRSLAHAERIAPAELQAARSRCRELAGDLMAAIAGVDVLILPTTLRTAPTVQEANVEDEGPRPPVVRALTHLCGPINWCPLASVSVPCGFGTGGLPIGMQVIARDEAVALGAALGFQQATDHHLKKPPLDAVRGRGSSR